MRYLLTLILLAAPCAATQADEALHLAQLTQPPVPRTAALEARVQQLEEELRRLTGRIEELEYAQRQLEQRLAAGTPPAAAAPPASLSAAEPDPEPESAAGGGREASAPQPPATVIEPDAAARQGYVLGAIPQGAVRDQPPAVTSDDRYQAGLELLQAARWAEAEQAFASFVQENPDDPRTPTASYWLGETYLLRKDYATAAAVFARNYRTYGEEARRAPDNLLKLGVALAAVGDRERACQTFAELGRRHPDAPAPIRQALSRERSAAGCG
jgi:tol-pal system protein YbgF